MRTYQARPKWDLERSLRRQVLRERALAVLAALLIFLAIVLVWPA